MRFSSPMKAIGLTSVQTISKSQPFRSKLFLIFTFGLALFLVPALCMKVAAQQNSETASMSRVAGGNALSDDTRYRIGPGDVLSIIVRKAPELSLEAVRVDQRGMIRIPMINEGVPAACKTESELATHIATLYLEYKNMPSVDVFVKEFQSQPVFVIGAVDKPGQFRLQRQVRLLELISFAGGPTDKAGRVIDVIHTGGPNICAKDAADGAAAALGVFKLNETMNGKEEANPLIRPGDVISLPEADLVFVVGYVYQPRSIPLKDKPITVSRAVAMAGGPQRDASTNRVRIIRQMADGVNKQEIPVDLKAIMKQKAEDITLLPNDIVEVGSSSTKMLMNILTGTLPAVLSQGVVRAIP
jgi:polysaccharide export outer membrane protein